MSTGGNRKNSSPSDIRYWQRAQQANFAETHKAKRVARHKSRMAKKAAKLLVRASRPARSFSGVA